MPKTKEGDLDDSDALTEAPLDTKLVHIDPQNDPPSAVNVHQAWGSQWTRYPYTIIKIFLGVFALLLFWTHPRDRSYVPLHMTRWLLHCRFGFDHSRHLGQYSPYFAVASYIPPPQNCMVDQVSILTRHGARWPTRAVTPALTHLIGRLKTAQLSDRGLQNLRWLREYEYTLGSEALVPLGLRQSKEAGELAYSRYGALAARRGAFIRSSSSPRVVASAVEWIKGFAQKSNHSVSLPYPLVISDALDSNDTLANANCPAYRPVHLHWQWARLFTQKIVRRLETMFKTLKFESKDVIALFALCAFDSVHTETSSPFCGLFERNDFLDFEYYQDLEKYYNRGYGNPLGPVQGVGYVNELLARLAGTPVRDYTNTNRTLDRDPTSFPLGEGFYADFTHDNTMAAIASALGLFRDANPQSPLPADRRSPHRKWKFGHIAPFSGRLVFERLACKEQSHTFQAIRILANDAVLPLPFCKGASTHAKGSLCDLDAFFQSQSYAREGGQQDWQRCHV